MFNLFFMLSATLLIIISLYILFKLNKKRIIDPLENEHADDYLYADKIFVRDPEAFKDKDKDGIDDIIDNNIK